MDVSTVYRALDWMSRVFHEEPDENIFSLTIHGGEPLLAGFEMIKTILEGVRSRVGNRKYRIGLQSNLWLFDESFAELFQKYNVSIGTSLDGPEHINDLTRGKGSFRRTMAGIELARSYQLNPGVIATISRPILPYWQQVLDFFLDQRLTLSLHPSIQKGRDNKYSIDETEYSSILDQTMTYYTMHMSDLRITTLDNFIGAVMRGESSICTFKECAGLFSVVDPHGDIFHCQRFAGQRTFRLASLSENLGYNELLNRVACHPVSEYIKGRMDECSACEASDFCTAGCFHNALSCSQSSDPYCGAYRFIARRIRKELIERLPEIQDGKDQFVKLASKKYHPYITAGNAKRIIAAYLFAKVGDNTVDALLELGIGNDRQRLEVAVENMKILLNGRPAFNNVYLHVTFRCQLACTHCYNKKRFNAAVEPEMDFQNIKRILSDPGIQRFRQVVITGGEPLFHRQIGEILSLLRQLRQNGCLPKTVLRTNFLSIPENSSLKDIASSFDSIIVSIDGREVEHDVRRGKGCYRKSMSNVSDYQKMTHTWNKGAVLSIAACLDMDADYDVVSRDLCSVADRLGIRQVRFNPVLPIGNAVCPDQHYEAKNYGDTAVAVKEGFQPVVSCGLGSNLYIEPDGGVYPCYVINNQRTKISSVFNLGISELIDSTDFQQLSSSTVDDQAECCHCDYRYLCGGLCRAYTPEKTPDSGTVLCGEKYAKSERMLEAAAEHLSIDPNKIKFWRKNERDNGTNQRFPEGWRYG